jgi:hypothetical protein
LISPRVAADGRVTISIYAPKASEVAVTGDWQTPFAPVALQKSAEGVWSIDVGPLPADLGRFARSGTDRRRSERSGACTSTHGGGDEDSGWSTIGRAGFVLDNLLAADKAVPMIVVMPNGSLPPPAASSGTPSDFAAAQVRFVPELMDDVIPFVETTFRVRTNPGDRALAGLSMGGMQTTQVFTRIPASSATSRFGARDCSGENDFARPGSEALAAVLDVHGIDNELTLTSGGHTWINWRRYLNELAPRLFR